ncbi:MAG TPA: hypothetical protein VN030_11515 [Cellvibrio sp.]|nr:hypothetical protein [Cellvibrio sp.]
MKNNPEDEEFIKKCKNDKDWPKDLDRPVDWDDVPWHKKFWFKHKGKFQCLAWIAFFACITYACGTTGFLGFGRGGASLEEGQYDYGVYR